MRNRSTFKDSKGSTPNTFWGGRRNRSVTSVAVTGKHFPARMKIGTPCQRQVSTASRTATKVSVVDPASTPATSWYPSY